MILKIKTALENIKPDENLVLSTAQMLRDRQDNRKSSMKSPLKKLAFAACFVMIFGALSFAGYAYYQTPVSFLSVDINPSMEIGINFMDRVVSVEGFNEEGVTLLSAQRLYGRKSGTAIDLLLQSADANGYIQQDGTTVVSIVAGGKNEDSAQKLIIAVENQITNSSFHAVLYCGCAASELKRDADSRSISFGKLKLIRMIQKLDSTADMEIYRNMSVSSILEHLTYLTSEEYTGASSQQKETVRAELGKTLTQLQQRRAENHNRNGQSQGDPAQSGGVVQDEGCNSAECQNTIQGEFGAQAECRKPSPDTNGVQMQSDLNGAYNILDNEQNVSGITSGPSGMSGQDASAGGPADMTQQNGKK